eukprot:maker-scaffold_19-snap-gene-5.57-mRNA-1 protein AED:0.00 eAED:0.00 QI:115/1/1/1/1/1/2/38/253
MFPKNINQSGSRRHTLNENAPQGTNLKTDWVPSQEITHRNSSGGPKNKSPLQENVRVTSVYTSVLLPDDGKCTEAVYKLRETEWIIKNVKNFYEQFANFAVVLIDHADEFKYAVRTGKIKNEGYPKGIKYQWKDEDSGSSDILAVSDYLYNVLIWMDGALEEVDVRNIEGKFRTKIERITRRLFRVMAIILTNKAFCKGRELNIDWKKFGETSEHFLYFGWEWNILREKETIFLLEQLRSVKKRFEVEKLKHA